MTTATFMAGASFAYLARTHAVALRLRADLERMKPSEPRDFHLERVGELVALYHDEIKRRADLAQGLGDWGRQG